MPLLSRAILRATATTFALCAVALLFTGCDSGDDEGPDSQQSEFDVRYELDGICSGIQVYTYNVTTGGSVSESNSGTLTLPWSREHTVLAPPSPPTATALVATCQGANEVAQTLTGRILVDGEERAAQTNEGTGSITVTLSVLLR